MRAERSMHLPAEKEREFYDAQYRQFLELPDADLVCNRSTLAAGLADAANPSYERRVVYGAALGYLLSEALTGRTALDYGCGTGDWGLMLAGEGALVTRSEEHTSELQSLRHLV